MKNFFGVLIFLGALSAHAAAPLPPYEKIINPVQISGILEHLQYQLNQAMITFFKKSRSSIWITSTHLHLDSKLICQKTYAVTETTDLEIVRTQKMISPILMSMSESLILKACNNSFEIFSVERQGVGLTPTPDKLLMKGLFPDHQMTTSYSLSLVGQMVDIRINQNTTGQQMNLVIGGPILGGGKFQLLIEEIFKDGHLAHQVSRFDFINHDVTLQSHQLQYAWRLDPANQVPREYTYYSQLIKPQTQSGTNEVSPQIYLTALYQVYQEAVYPVFKGTLSFIFTSL
ncbi:MAG: hypothetical protein H7061_02065 [Bdellovibrionaceae bacterium]|nr:hypothetical protein [Bdellovibrio sp.]